MKKLLTLALLIGALSLSILGLAACKKQSDYEISVEGYTLQINKDGTYSIVGLPEEISRSSEWTVPTEIGGYPIVGVGGQARVYPWFGPTYAMGGLGNIRKIKIPAGIQFLDVHQCELVVIETEVPLSQIEISSEYCDWEKVWYLSPQEDVDRRYLTQENVVDNMIIVKNQVFDEENVQTEEGATLLYAFGDGELYIPDAYNGLPITQIGDYAFEGEDFFKVMLGKNVQKIGEYAFKAADTQEVVFPEGLSTIHKNAFCDSKLTEFRLPETIKIIEAQAFRGCHFTELTLPEHILQVGEGAFAFNPIENIDLSAYTLDYISASMFFGCPLAGEIILPNTIKTIGNGAFSGASFTSFDFPDSVESIGDKAFYEVPLTELQFPNALKTIGSSAFEDAKIKNLIFPDGVQTIDEKAFENNELENIVLPDSIQSISRKAFADNPLIKEFILPDSCRLFNGSAIDGCINIEKLHVANVSAFEFGDRLPNLKEITISPTNQYLAVEDGILYGIRIISNLAEEGIVLPEHYVKEVLIRCPAKLQIEEIELQNCAVQPYAFADNPYIKHVALDQNSVAEWSFFGCAALESVTLSDCVNFIERSAFAECEQLTAINTEKVTYFGIDAFNGCKKLQSVAFDSVTKIDADAFKNCDFREVYLSNCDTVGSGAFENNVNLTKAQLIDCRRVGACAFAHCKKLKSFEAEGASLGHNVLYGTPLYEDPNKPKGCQYRRFLFWVW